MKLTKDQRCTMYCILLEEAERPSMFEHPEFIGEYYYSNSSGLCWMWRIIVGDFDMYCNPEQLLPELYNKKITELPYWFKNWEERIKVLKKCIKETENF